MAATLQRTAAKKLHQAANCRQGTLEGGPLQSGSTRCLVVGKSLSPKLVGWASEYQQLQLEIVDNRWGSRHLQSTKCFQRANDWHGLSTRGCPNQRRRSSKSNVGPLNAVAVQKPTYPVEELGKAQDQACILQAFNWGSCRRDARSWYQLLLDSVDSIEEGAFTDVLLPPCCQSLDPQGFMPVDFYELDTSYGTAEELRQLIAALHSRGVHAIADLVINRLAGVATDSTVSWKKAGGTVADDIDWMDWVSGSGSPALLTEDASADSYPGLAAIDHSNPVVQSDLKGWLLWLKTEVGFDGWFFDYARGFDPQAVANYGEASGPSLAIADYWNPMRYNGTSLEYGQDQHREDLCNWVKATGGSARVLDYTTKGILQMAVERCEYWRLIDPKGRPPGMIGWWPAKAVTFVDNHSTGSEPRHWPFPDWGVMLGYAYILTHPGTPCVFWDHVHAWKHKDAIYSLLAVRRRNGIHAQSSVRITACHSDLYVAQVGSFDGPDQAFRGVYVKLGPSMNLRGGGPPGSDWVVAASGHDYCVWEQR
ncbi:alpha amylase [Klebsormidium nitens]|uniref:alpha-amylase n=1 Tax=Klebsormidium nitens TaxID=105231 RepID=A0A1Y1HSK3_KLENI|nr:alpha amylase [Klebsormidium nitens]|eukprot:GAQ81605.1 alpha amylase [Klebsormidium nitens]